MANIYTAALMEHNAHPDYKYQMPNPTHVRDGVNPSCGDELTLMLRVKNGVIEEVSFTGHGCAISQASADMMADLITGETVEEAQRLCGIFLGMVRGEKLSAQDREDLDEAAELEAISYMPARVKCAQLAWRTLEDVLAGGDAAAGGDSAAGATDSSVDAGAGGGAGAGAGAGAGGSVSAGTTTTEGANEDEGADAD